MKNFLMKVMKLFELDHCDTYPVRCHYDMGIYLWH